MKKTLSIQNLVFSGICLALCLVLAFITGQIPEIGNMLLPMHLPVLLCGFLCGGPWGAAVGFSAPLLRFLLFGMPPLFPIAINMSFELMAYGLVAGILYRLLPKKKIHIYTSLILAMLLGRVVWGMAAFVTFSIAGMQLTWSIFVAQAFLNAIPGILLHILLIPVLVMVIQRGVPNARLQN